MTRIEHNQKCWRKIRDDKEGIKFINKKNGNETRTVFKLGRSWIHTGGREKPENVTFGPSFFSSKKKAVEVLQRTVKRCPITKKNKQGLVITSYKD